MNLPPIDEAAAAEHRRLFPDRKCEVDGCDSKRQVFVSDGHQLCWDHLAEYDAVMFHPTMREERLKRWIDGMNKSSRKA